MSMGADAFRLVEQVSHVAGEEGGIYRNPPKAQSNWQNQWSIHRPDTY